MVEELLEALGIKPKHLKAVLLTHRHLDHVGNLAYWVEKLGCAVYAHREEQPHIDGTYPYQGVTRICGWMEGVGRGMFLYRRVRITHPIEDGEELPFFGGLEVLHLPGHSRGHCGFYSRKLDPPESLHRARSRLACKTFPPVLSHPSSNGVNTLSFI